MAANVAVSRIVVGGAMDLRVAVSRVIVGADQDLRVAVSRIVVGATPDRSRNIYVQTADGLRRGHMCVATAGGIVEAT